MKTQFITTNKEVCLVTAGCVVKTCCVTMLVCQIGYHWLFLIAVKANSKEIDIARSYIAKGSCTDDNMGSYWNVRIGRGDYY